MDTLTARTLVEVEQQVIAAGERARWSEHMRKHCAGVAAVCRWLLGQNPIAPATREHRAPDSVVEEAGGWRPDAVTLERMLACDMEDTAARRREDTVELHAMAYTLCWYQRMPAAEVAPLP